MLVCRSHLRPRAVTLRALGALPTPGLYPLRPVPPLPVYCHLHAECGEAHPASQNILCSARGSELQPPVSPWTWTLAPLCPLPLVTAVIVPRLFLPRRRIYALFFDEISSAFFLCPSRQQLMSPFFQVYSKCRSVAIISCLEHDFFFSCMRQTCFKSPLSVPRSNSVFNQASCSRPSRNVTSFNYVFVKYRSIMTSC